MIDLKENLNNGIVEPEFMDDFTKNNDKKNKWCEEQQEENPDDYFIHSYGYGDDFDLNSDSFKYFYSRTQDKPNINYHFKVGDKVLVIQYINFCIKYIPATILSESEHRFRYKVEIDIKGKKENDYVEYVIPYDKELAKKGFEVDANRAVIQLIRRQVKFSRNAISDTIDSMEHEIQFFYYGDSEFGAYSFKNILQALKMEFKMLKVKEYLGEDSFAEEWNCSLKSLF